MQHESAASVIAGTMDVASPKPAWAKLVDQTRCTGCHVCPSEKDPRLVLAGLAELARGRVSRHDEDLRTTGAASHHRTARTATTARTLTNAHRAAGADDALGAAGADNGGMP